MIGIHAFFGSFVAGVIVPKGNKYKLTESLCPRMELLTKDFLLPLYFASSGIKTNIGSLSSGTDWGYVFAIILIAVAAKFIPGCLVTKLVTGRDWRYCVTFGFLMNTRGLVELIALNVGLQTGVLSVRLFTVLVLMAILTTLMTSPLLWTIYKAPHDERLAVRRRQQVTDMRNFVDEDVFNNTVSNASFFETPLAVFANGSADTQLPNSPDSAVLAATAHEPTRE